MIYTTDPSQNWRNTKRVEFIKGFYQIGHSIDTMFDLYEATQHLSHTRVEKLLERNLRMLREVSYILYRVADEAGVDRRFQRYFDKLLGELWHELDKLRNNARLLETYQFEEAGLDSRRVRGLKTIDRQIITDARRDLPRQVSRARRLYGNLVPLFESILPQYSNNAVILRTLYFSRETFDRLIGGDSLAHFYRVIFRGRVLEGYRATAQSLIDTAHYAEAKQVLECGLKWAEENRPSAPLVTQLQAMMSEVEEKLSAMPPPFYAAV